MTKKLSERVRDGYFTNEWTDGTRIVAEAAIADEIESLERKMGTLLEALKKGRKAIGDHYAPDDCYATGPLTGNAYRDLVQCPACSFIEMYDAAIKSVEGEK